MESTNHLADVVSPRAATARYIAAHQMEDIASAGDLEAWVFNTIFDELMQSAPGELERLLKELECDS